MVKCIEKLLKFLKLEIDRKYDNKAVLGGLEKAIPAWQEEASNSGLPQGIINQVIQSLKGYPAQSYEERARTVQFLIAYLNDQENLKTSLKNADVTAPNLPSQPQNQISHQNNKDLPKPIRTQASGNNNSDLGLYAPVTVLPGIGQKNGSLLASLGIVTLVDLLYYFPRRYDDYSKFKPISHVMYGDELTIIAEIKSISSRLIKNGRFQITEAIVGDGTGFLRVNWFNQPWLDKKISPGDQLVLAGKVDMYLGRQVMNNPDWEPLEKEHLHTNRIVPVYPSTGKLKQHLLRKIMFQTVNYWTPRINDFLPSEIIEEAGLLNLPNAISQIHFPDSQEALHAARDRLAFDEIFLLQIGVLQQKRQWESVVAKIFSCDEAWMKKTMSSLPFQLTNSQLDAVTVIKKDLESERPMNRLLQGDVGAGKTIVAAITIAIVSQMGSQSAIMAPTSILAEQHYKNLRHFFTNVTRNESLGDHQIRLLIGDTPNREKDEIREGLKNGQIKLVIGTHALIEETVLFKDLSLVIVDEQHRFGVEQRALLRSKGTNPHLLVMTATPIPRSLALTIYGDLDLTVIDEMPTGRLPVETWLLHPYERERAYQLINQQIELGHQAFVVYPLVEQVNDNNGQAAVDEQKRLQSDVFPGINVGLLHGRMAPDEKTAIMRKFTDGVYQVLVSTSVIEVGMDVPNATVMLIEGANRFGLAQLHQLRGRVGRGNSKSFCLLIPDSKDEIANDRLRVMTETNDGFILADQDLEQRGPGDFLGIRQSGYNGLKMANISNVHLIEKARKYAIRLFESDPDLTSPPNHPLKRMKERLWTSGKGDIS